MFTLLLSLAVPALAQVYGVDNSVAVSSGTYSTALGEGYSHLVIRGYQEACSIGGRVDPNFVGNYNNAVAAGYTEIDAYMFPCTGSGNACNSYADQVGALADTISSNGLNIGTIWIDIEVDSSCGTWDYGASGNLAQAQALVSAAQDTGFNIGIYSSPGEWSQVFGSYGVVLDNSLPLWFATYDGVATLTLGTPFGGWTEGAGKQYTDQSASGDFDLNYFAN